MADFCVGDIVKHGENQGVVMFIGETEFKQGTWVGIKLDHPFGKNDGSVNNVRYFKCPMNHGLFARVEKVHLSHKATATKNDQSIPDTTYNQLSITPEQEISLEEVGHHFTNLNAAIHDNNNGSGSNNNNGIDKDNSSNDNNNKSNKSPPCSIDLQNITQRFDASENCASTKSLSDQNFEMQELNNSSSQLQTNDHTGTKKAPGQNVVLRFAENHETNTDASFDQGQHMHSELSAHSNLIESVSLRQDILQSKDVTDKGACPDAFPQSVVSNQLIDISTTGGCIATQTEHSKLWALQRTITDMRQQLLEEKATTQQLRDQISSHLARELICQQQNTALQRELEEARAGQGNTKKADLEAKLHTAEETVECLEEQATAFKRCITQLKDENAALKEKAMCLETYKAESEQFVLELQKEKKLAAENFKFSLERIKALEEECAQLQYTISSMETSHVNELDRVQTHLEEELECQKHENKKLRQQMEDVKTRYKQESRVQQATALADLRQLEMVLKQEKEKTKELTQALGTQSTSNIDLKAKVLSLEQINQESEKVISERDEAISIFEDQLSEMVSHVQAKKKQIEELETTLDRVLQRLDIAVEKGAIPPLRPQDIKLMGARPPSEKKLLVCIPAVKPVHIQRKEFYMYQIYITVADEQWVIHRRYSQLLEFHREITQHLPGADGFFFPPKVALGNRSPNLIETRRLQLQGYLQEIVRLARKTPGTPIQQELSKQALLLTLPFLGEDTSTMSSMPRLDDG